MCAAFSTILGATALAVGAGVGATALAGGFNRPASPSVSMPQAPKMGDASAKAQAMGLKRAKAMGRQESIQTSPLGIAGEAEITKKKLLGE